MRIVNCDQTQGHVEEGCPVTISCRGATLTILIAKIFFLQFPGRASASNSRGEAAVATLTTSYICLSMQSHLLQSQSSNQPCACSAARIPPCKGELRLSWADFGSKMLPGHWQARDSTACHLEPEAGPCDQRLTRQTENQILSTTLITGGTSARANVRGECSWPKLEL